MQHPLQPIAQIFLDWINQRRELQEYAMDRTVFVVERARLMFNFMERVLNINEAMYCVDPNQYMLWRLQEISFLLSFYLDACQVLEARLDSDTFMELTIMSMWINEKISSRIRRIQQEAREVRQRMTQRSPPPSYEVFCANLESMAIRGDNNISPISVTEVTTDQVP